MSDMETPEAMLAAEVMRLSRELRRRDAVIKALVEYIAGNVSLSPVAVAAAVGVGGILGYVLHRALAKPELEQEPKT